MHYLSSGGKNKLPICKRHKPPQEKQQRTPFPQGI
jgi:hypothetical protein